MGFAASAHLAFGYDLGSEEEFNAEQRDEYGNPVLPWLHSEEPDFLEAAQTHLLHAAGFTETWETQKTPESRATFFQRKSAVWKKIGVETYPTGHYDHPGWILIAQGSHRFVDWADTMELDLDILGELPIANDWDNKLTHALTTLGITPYQENPRWIVFPNYG